MAGSPSSRFTWEVQPAASDGPGLRSRHCLAYDAEAQATILFGGIVWHGDGILRADTWELRKGRWAQVECPKGPPARHRGAMTYDPLRGHSVLFGGQGTTYKFLNDTWLYADARWQKWRARWWTPRPAPRCGHCLAFDATVGTVVLFGGLDRSDRPLGDTWQFDGSTWQPIRGPAPPARRYAAFAYDPALKGCVLHGGAIDDRGRRKFGDAWLYREHAWTDLGPDFDTDPRDDHGLAYHQSARCLVMLEGISGERGLLLRKADGWHAAEAKPLHPRHQCSPLVWDERLGGLVLHGGEVRHGGPQFNDTLLLRLAVA